MKEIGPIAGIDCKNTMTEINHAKGIDCQSITKKIMKESIIIHYRTMEIGENIKIIIKTSIGITISMIMIDLMIWIILMVEIGHMTETGHIVETGTTPKNTKETAHTLDIDHMTEMILIVEIDCQAITENVKTRNMREGLKTIIKTGTARIIIEIVTKTKISIKTKTDTRMTAIARLVSLNREITSMMRMTNFTQKLKGCHKILQTMSPEKEIAIGFMITFSENPDKILDSICSPADVDHLISKRIEYAKTQKAENLTKDPHVNITSNKSSHNYESVNMGLELTQEPVYTEIIEDSNSDSEEEVQILDLGECKIIVELDFREEEQIPHIMVQLTEGQVLEEFMLEEDTEFQERETNVKL